jgi:hypothetical protein
MGIQNVLRTVNTNPADHRHHHILLTTSSPTSNCPYSRSSCPCSSLLMHLLQFLPMMAVQACSPVRQVTCWRSRAAGVGVVRGRRMERCWMRVVRASSKRVADRSLRGGHYRNAETVEISHPHCVNTSVRSDRSVRRPNTALL